MELFWLNSIMGLLLSLCTSSEKVKRRLPTAASTSCLQGGKGPHQEPAAAAATSSRKQHVSESSLA
jgi:hypothetical protein